MTAEAGGGRGVERARAAAMPARSSTTGASVTAATIDACASAMPLRASARNIQPAPRATRAALSRAALLWAALPRVGVRRGAAVPAGRGCRERSCRSRGCRSRRGDGRAGASPRRCARRVVVAVDAQPVRARPGGTDSRSVWRPGAQLAEPDLLDAPDAVVGDDVERGHARAVDEHGDVGAAVGRRALARPLRRQPRLQRRRRAVCAERERRSRTSRRRRRRRARRAPPPQVPSRSQRAGGERARRDLDGAAVDARADRASASSVT